MSNMLASILLYGWARFHLTDGPECCHPMYLKRDVCFEMVSWLDRVSNTTILTPEGESLFLNSSLGTKRRQRHVTSQLGRSKESQWTLHLKSIEL